MQKNAIVVTIISLVAIFGFLFAVYSFSNKPGTQSTVKYSEVSKIAKDDHVKWSPRKKAVLVEYGDLQCPACKTFHEILRSFEFPNSPDRDIVNNVTFVYRNFPLDMHKNAVPAARAAEAAGQQGKYFEYVSALYDQQESWAELKNPIEYFVPLAEKFKLNVEQFKNDMASPKTQAKIDKDLAQGNKVTVTSTPTFFLDGVKLEVESLDEFKALLKNASK